MIRLAAFFLAVGCGAGMAGSAGAQTFSPEQIDKGAALYEQNCSGCHGSHMMDPQGAFDLRTFPHEEKARFVNSVSKGKNSMPPWGDLFKAEDIDALWAYVVAGERR